MADHATGGAEGTGVAAARPSLIARLFHNWTARRRLARLADLDDRMLDDIGLSREELRSALNAPLTVDPAGELERAALRRRLGQARKRPGWGAY